MSSRWNHATTSVEWHILAKFYSYLGICCIGASFVKDNESLRILQISLSMGIRFIAGVSIKVILTMVAELYPTPIRSTTMGIGAMASAIGAFFGLLIESLALIWSPLPLLVIGILATLAFILCFFIPETKNEPLPETIEDAINIGSNKLIIEKF